MEIKRAYKARIYPNQSQEQFFIKTIGACRFVYNYYLEMHKTTYVQTGGTLQYAFMSRDLTALRNGGQYPWLAEVQTMPLQQSLRQLEKAYGNFFRKHQSFPRFKSKNDSKQSFRKSKDWKIVGNRIRLMAGFTFRYRGREIPSNAQLGTLTISRSASGKWYAAIQTTETYAQPPLNGAVGLDLGINNLAITSDGQKFDNPNIAKQKLKQLKSLQQSLSRKQKGSKSRAKAKLQVARLHEKIANQRMNHLHQVSSAITRKNHALIAVEDLAVANMLKNRRLSRSISDVSWGEFLRQLTYKQMWLGGQLIKVNRYFPSSKTCSSCSYIAQDMSLAIRQWKCPKCGVSHDRDINAAKNILKQAEVQLGAESTESKAFSPMVAGLSKH